MSYESLRRQVRTLENSLETQITTYAKLGTKAANGYSSNGKLSETTVQEAKQLENKVAEDVSQVASEYSLSLLVDQMGRLLETMHPPPTISMQHTAQRHREILGDYERDFKRTKASLHDAEQRASLLSSVRSEISSFKSAQQSAQDQLLTERGHIDSSHRIADDVLGQAYETRHEFQRQRNILQGSNNRMASVVSSVPGINSLVGMINSRRRKENMFLSLLVGTCLFILLMYTFR